VTANRSSPECADYRLEVAIRYPVADTIHSVMDNLSSHTRKAVVEGFDRFRVHYTPKHGSWLNQAEIAISLFARHCLSPRQIGNRASLRRETQAWSRRMNRHRVPIRWKFTRKKARPTFGYTITRLRY
jgi:transposase